MDYLDKFRKKPAPKKQMQVQVAIPKTDVEINVKIVDKRKESTVDRKSILERIKRKELRPPTLPLEIPDDLPNLVTPTPPDPVLMTPEEFKAYQEEQAKL